MANFCSKPCIVAFLATLLACESKVSTTNRSPTDAAFEGQDLTPITVGGTVHGLTDPVAHSMVKIYGVEMSSNEPELLETTSANGAGLYQSEVETLEHGALLVLAFDGENFVGQALRPLDGSSSEDRLTIDIDFASSVSASILMGQDVDLSSMPTGKWSEFSAIVNASISADMSSQGIGAVAATLVKTVDVKVALSQLREAGGKSPAAAMAKSQAFSSIGAVIATPISAQDGEKLVSISVQATSTTMPKGSSRTLSAWGTYGDGSTADLSTAVTWKVGNPQILSLSTTSAVTASGLLPGTSTVTATLGSVSGSLQLTVTPAELSAIAISPAQANLAPSTTQAFVATGTFTDSTTEDLTTSVEWESSATTVATVDNASQKGLVTAINAGTATITATKSGISSTSTVSVSTATLTSVQIDPAAPSIAKGLTADLTATATFSDGSTQNVTNLVTWVSSDNAVATMTGRTIEGIAVGSSTITASWLGISGTTLATITAATVRSIEVTAADATLPLGAAQNYTATAIYTDNTNQDVTELASWTSSNAQKASVSDTSGTKGEVTAAEIGTTSISASYQSVSGSANLTVVAAVLESIAVTPTAPSIALGTQRQLAATGTYSDGSTQDLTTSVAWASSDVTKATISNVTGTKGLASSVATGSTAISATSGSVSGSTSLTVTAATLQSIVVSAAYATVADGISQQFTATGTYSDGSTQNLSTQVTWSSSDQAVVSISNVDGSRGLASALSPGLTSIGATLSGISGSTDYTITAAELVSIAVTPTTPTIALGTTQQFTATGTYTDGSTLDITTQVTWQSSLTSKATISNVDGTRGLASSLATGTTTISAISGSITGQTTLAIGAASLVSIAVTPATPSVAKGSTLQFTATGTYTDSSTQDVTTSAAWTSANTSVSTISNTMGTTGLATAVATGTTTITATIGGVSGDTSLSVDPAALASIAVTPETTTIASGGTQQFTATGTYTDASTQDLTTTANWTSSNTSYATIAAGTGLATAVGVGTTTITASLSAISGSTTLAVTAAAASVTVTSPNGGETFYAGTVAQPITWTSSGVAGNVKIELWNGTSYSTIAASVSNTGSYNWLPSSTVPSATIRISDVGNASVNDSSDSAFGVAAPIISIIDNGTTGYSESGTWANPSGTNFTSMYNSTTRIVNSGNAASATWAFTGLTAGRYRVSTSYKAFTNRSSVVPFTVSGGASPTTVNVNQQNAPADLTHSSWTWEDLVTSYSITGSTLSVTIDAASASPTGGSWYSIADAVRIEYIGP